MFENWNCLVCGKPVEPRAWFIIVQGELRDKPVHLGCALRVENSHPLREERRRESAAQCAVRR
ncbi:MAG: hypothetical protein ACTSUQ_04090 [Candidatus Freyarchaeota archaeon]